MVGLHQNPRHGSGRLVDLSLDLPAELHNSAVLLNQTLRGKEVPEVPIGVKHPLNDAKGYAVGLASYGFLAVGVDFAGGLVDIVVNLGRSNFVVRAVVQWCLCWGVDIRRDVFGGCNVGLSQYRYGRRSK